MNLKYTTGEEFVGPIYNNHYKTIWKYGTDDCQEDV